MSNTNTNLLTQTLSVLQNDTVSSCSTSKVQEKTQLSRSRCKNSLREVKSQFKFLSETLQDFVLSKEDLKGTRIEHGFKRAFMSLFGQDVDTFTSTMLLNVDQLQKELDKDEFQEDGSMATFWVYDRRVNKRQMQTQESKIDMGKVVDDDLVVTKSSGTESKVQDDNSRSGNDTDADDADIRPIYDEELIVEYTKQCQVKSPMLDSSLDNQTTEYSKQSLESENILLKKTVAQFQKDFSRMEAHCIALELKYQNQALKSGQHGQILNETSNKAKIKKEIDVLETMNIELEHSVAKLRKENETLKKHYKDLYDSIKITRSKTIEQTTSLLANNADLKAQIQEKVFAIAALKNDLRKLKGNSVDTKFAKTSVLGKPVLQSLRNQSVVRQPNAFKSERPQMSKRFAPMLRLGITICQDHTADGSKPKPRSTNHSTRSLSVSKSSCITITVVPKTDHSKNSSSFSDSKHFVCSTCQKCVFNANHDAFIIKILKEVNSRAKIQSYKTKNSNNPVYQKSHTQKPGRQIFARHRFSPNKTSDVYEKTSPRSDLRWKPTSRIFKYVVLRWIPTGNLFDSCTRKVDSEPPHGSNVDILNIHECKQTLDVSTGTSIIVQKEQSLDLSAGTLCNVNKENLRVWLLKKLISQKPLSKWIHR
ncbi:hypothetical protein Tco_0321893 [Tanacetum coccineum]